MNVTSTHISTTVVSCSVATSLSESLPNDSEKPNQPKRLLSLKCDYGGCLWRFLWWLHLFYTDSTLRLHCISTPPACVIPLKEDVQTKITCNLFHEAIVRCYNYV